jgi:3-oxoacyl-[acyl-carrier-protein] synthase II
MKSARDVVITGVGVVSPIGIGRDAFWSSLRERRSGVARITRFDASCLPAPFGGEIREFDGKQFVRPRKALKVMNREIQTAFSAATLAMDTARLAAGGFDPDRVGVVLGSEMLYGDIEELLDVYRECVEDGQFNFSRWGERAMTQLYPLWMLKYLPNMAACHIGITYDARGPNNSITLGEVSSLLAIAEGTSVIERGHADVMIVGGSGNRLNVTGLVYRGDRNLSHRCDRPEAASRPFDAHRDGMVNGEGAAAFVLESAGHARARGAAVLGRVLGCGRAYGEVDNGQAGARAALARAITAALRDAGIRPEDVGHVNAHGLSTVEGDRAEAQAIRSTLGDVPVTAPKSFFGNLGAGGGAVELAASLLGFVHDEVPVTLNYEYPDPECPVRVVHGEPLRGARPVAVAINKSSTGQAAAVVIAGA